MDPLASFLETINLAPVFFGVVFYAAVITVYVMQVTSSHHVNARDPVWVQGIHRGLFLAMALTFVWMLSFVYDKAWQPWPPVFVLVILWCALFTLRAYVIHRTFPREKVAGLGAPAAAQGIARYPHRLR